MLPETRSLLEKQLRNRNVSIKRKQNLNLFTIFTCFTFFFLIYFKIKENITKSSSSKQNENDISRNRLKQKRSAKSKPTYISSDLTRKQNSRVKKWLEKNSLIALKLTLFDALFETSDQKAAENVLILDYLFNTDIWKDVSSKNNSFYFFILFLFFCEFTF